MTPVMIKHKRIVRRTCVPHSLPDALHPALARIYASRGALNAEDLEYGLKSLPRPESMKDLSAVGLRLKAALERQQRILIVGDYDSDGATSTALVVSALTAFGHHNIGYLVPDRAKHGYGLTPMLVELAAEQSPDILLTVDNGISSIHGVHQANQLGMEVIVTDHHLPGAPLPEGTLCVNPNQRGCSFPGKNLAGVGVAFYVMSHLRAVLRESGWFERQEIPEPRLASLLDLVALGTVADVVPLDHLNRALVAQGLARINAGHCRPGIRALLEQGRRRIGGIVASDLAFAAGPRLNAAGRLSDMSIGIECLLAKSDGAARELASRLEELNLERREVEAVMKQQALQLAAQALDKANVEQKLGLCLYREQWHEGVVGLVAQRIRESSGRPVIAFANSSNGILKGSGRSIPGLHMRDLISNIASRNPDLIERFGGHAMAAGLSLQADRLESFRDAFDAELGEMISADELGDVVQSDGELSAEALELPFARMLREAGPWGAKFEEPLFDGEFEIQQQRVVGEKHLKLLLRPCGADAMIDGICFNHEDKLAAPWPPKLRLAYRAEVNEFRGQTSLQLNIETVETIEADLVNAND